MEKYPKYENLIGNLNNLVILSRIIVTYNCNKIKLLNQLVGHIKITMEKQKKVKTELASKNNGRISLSMVRKAIF